MKRQFILAILCCIFINSVFAQKGNNNYSLLDSTVIPARRMPQYNEFINGTYDFPAKPRSQWELGLSAGSLHISGNVDSRLQFLNTGATAISIRKSLGHVFSIRGEIMFWGQARGLDYKPSVNYFRNAAWVNNGYYAAYRDQSGNLLAATQTSSGIVTRNTGYDPVFYNYKTKLNDFLIEGIISLNSFNAYKKTNRLNVYSLLGLGATFYKTSVNALKNNQSYSAEFSAINTKYGSDFNGNRKKILTELKAAIDDSYETDADGNYIDVNTEKKRKMFGKTYTPTITSGMGVAYRISDEINLALEFRNNWTFTSLLDGQRWQDYAVGDPVLSPKYDQYRYISIGIRFNLGKKSVTPLWWINPVAVYSETFSKNAPKIMRMPKPVLDDSDNDGVTDQFDGEPDTPAGCPVDAKGRSRDTDGDGVPDCKDKELITATRCLPVGPDGVGRCPDENLVANQNQQANQLSKFPWPPPEPSTLSGALKFNSTQLNTLNDVKEFLENKLNKANYEKLQYYSIPGGFALLAPLEQIESNGVPKNDPPRWTIKTDLSEDFSLSKYLSALIWGTKGYYRVLAFMVTDQALSFQKTSGQPILNLSGGRTDLPKQVQEQKISSDYRCYILVYEFNQKKSGTTPEFVKPGTSKISFLKHFANTPEIKNLFIQR